MLSFSRLIICCSCHCFTKSRIANSLLQTKSGFNKKSQHHLPYYRVKNVTLAIFIILKNIGNLEKSYTMDGYHYVMFPDALQCRPWRCHRNQIGTKSNVSLCQASLSSQATTRLSLALYQHHFEGCQHPRPFI